MFKSGADMATSWGACVGTWRFALADMCVCMFPLHVLEVMVHDYYLA